MELLILAILAAIAAGATAWGAMQNVKYATAEKFTLLMEAENARLRRELDERRCPATSPDADEVGDRPMLDADGKIDAQHLSTSVIRGCLELDPLRLQFDDRKCDGGDHAARIVVLVDRVQHLGADRKVFLELRIGVGETTTVVELDPELVDTHDDSSTGDDPAATGLTIRVEVAPCRGCGTGTTPPTSTPPADQVGVQ